MQNKRNGPVPRPMVERFWSHVNKTDACWLWNGKPMNGYGVIGLYSRGPRAYAHRVSWELHYGPIPDGLYVCHKCDVRNCVRPDHLFLGTNQENLADMWAKGRGRPGHVIGQGHGMAKLTDSDVRAIRARYAAGDARQSELAAEYGVSQPMIGYIVRGDNWKHLL